MYMKQQVLCVLFGLFFSLSACADRKEVITFAQLPQAAQDAISQNFNAANISYVTKESGWSNEFEVRFTDGVEIEFDGDGALKKVDCKANAVPEALIPAEVLSYVKMTFPNAFIKEWGQDDGGYKAELNNGLDLKFDKSYRFQRIDD